MDRIDAKFKAAKRNFEIEKAESVSAYESAIDEASSVRYSAMEKAKLEYGFAQEKVIAVRNKTSDKFRDKDITRDMKLIAAKYQISKKEADSAFDSMEARAKAALEEVAKDALASYGEAEASYIASKQAAIASREETKRLASTLYKAAVADPDAHYRSAVSREDSERIAARRQIRIAYDHAKQTAKVNQWHAYIEAYEGVTSDIPSIMEKVLNVDRQRCRLKFGD